MVKSRIDTQSEEQGVEGLWINGRMNAEIRSWRARVGWSASRLAKELGISRAYVKHLESRGHPWVVRSGVASRLRVLMEMTVPKGILSVGQPRLIFSRFVIPNRVRVMTKPRRCRGHQEWVIFGSANQVYCNRDCERMYRRRVRREQREKED